MRGRCPKFQQSGSHIAYTDGGLGTCTWLHRTTATQIVVSVSYSNWRDDWDEAPELYDALLDENTCTPRLRYGNFQDYGYALLTDDESPWIYNAPPPAILTERELKCRGQRPSGLPLHLVEPDSVIVEDRNSSRRATEEELSGLGLVECDSEGCVQEFAELGLDENGEPTLVHTTATATAEGTGPSDNTEAISPCTTPRSLATQTADDISEEEESDSPQTGMKHRQ